MFQCYNYVQVTMQVTIKVTIQEPSNKKCNISQGKNKATVALTAQVTLQKCCDTQYSQA